MNTAYLNKKFIPLDKAKISVLDRGFLYGDGIFETMRSYNGAVFRLEKHINRLFKSLKALGIKPPASKKELDKKIYKLLKKNRLLGNAYIKIIVTRGKTGGLLLPSEKSKPTLAIYALPYKGPSKSIYAKGIKAFILQTGFSQNCRTTKHKTLNYLPNILWRYEAKEKGFDDVILIDTNGFASEASSSNIFVAKGKKIYTPSLRCGILPGITREEVIRLAEKVLKIKVKQIFMKEKDLYGADEVFLTNSLAGIIPVTKVKRHVVGRGKPGFITKTLMEACKDEAKE